MASRGPDSSGIRSLLRLRSARTRNPLTSLKVTLRSPGDFSSVMRFRLHLRTSPTGEDRRNYEPDKCAAQVDRNIARRGRACRDKSLIKFLAGRENSARQPDSDHY